MSAPELSVVITCYFEEHSIDEFHARLAAALQRLGRSYEILFVNDGSTDATFAKLEAIYARDPGVYAIVDLFRNSGQPAAQTAAFEHMRGRCVIIMDSDLQLDPAELPVLLAKYDEGFDVVSGRRTQRRDALTRIVPSWIANTIMRKVSRSALTDFGCTFKAIRADLIRGCRYDAFKPWLAVDVIAQAGRVAEVPVSHYPRKYGTSGWTFRKLWQFNMTNVVRLSDKPFQLLSVLCAGVVLLFVVRLLIEAVMPISVMKQVTPGLLLNVVVLGIVAVLAVLAVVGEFVIRIFTILYRQPAYVVRTLRKRDLDGRSAVGG